MSKFLVDWSITGQITIEADSRATANALMEGMRPSDLVEESNYCEVTYDPPRDETRLADPAIARTYEIFVNAGLLDSADPVPEDEETFVIRGVRTTFAELVERSRKKMAK